MKHKFAAFFLAVMLLCTLLTSCVPSDSPNPGGNPSSTPSGDNNFGSEPDDSNGGTNSATKKTPSIKLETFSAPYVSYKKGYVASYVFSVTNPNANYSLSSVKVYLTLADDDRTTQTDYTTIQNIAPNDTIRFAYSRTYSNWRPTHVINYRVEGSFKVPATESDGTPKMACSNDLQILSQNQHISTKFDYDIIEGTVLNTSRYSCKCKVSLLLEKDGAIVYSTWVNSTSELPANGRFSFTIYAPKNIDYTSYKLIAIPA